MKASEAKRLNLFLESPDAMVGIPTSKIVYTNEDVGRENSMAKDTAPPKAG